MKNKNTMLMVLGLLAFMTNGDNYAAAPLLLKISEDLSLSMQQAAYSVTAYMLSFGFFTLIFGPLSDRYGKIRIIRIAAFGTAVFSILGGFSFNLQSLMVFRAFNGGFGAGVFPVTMALVGQSFNDSERQSALGKVMGMMFLGGATATAAGGILSYFGSWRLVYIVYGIGELIVAIIIARMLDKDNGVVDRLNFISAYKTPLSNHRFMRLVFTIFFVGFAVFGSFTYSGKLLQQITGLPVLQVGLILSFFGIGYCGRRADCTEAYKNTQTWFFSYRRELSVSAVFIFYHHSLILCFYVQVYSDSDYHLYSYRQHWFLLHR